MKRILWIGCTCLALQGLHAQTVKEIAAWQLEELLEFYEGKIPGAIIHFPQGWQVPLELFYSGDFFQLITPSEEPLYRVIVQREFFLSMPEKDQFLFSLDGNTWKSFEELVTGSFGFSLNQRDGTGPVLSAGGTLEERGVVR